MANKENRLIIIAGSYKTMPSAVVTIIKQKGREVNYYWLQAYVKYSILPCGFALIAN